MKNKYLIVTVFLTLLIIIGGYFVFKIPSTQNNQPSQDYSLSGNIESVDTNTLGASSAANINMDGKLEILDEVVGTGAEAVAGKHVTVNYTGTLTDGTKFDSSLNPGRTPFDFNLGAGEVIAGWDQGVAGMKIGGKRKLTIPPSLGYGAADMGVIPPNSTLIFEVELLKVQ